MIPVSYAVQGEKSSPKFASAFAAGCKGPATPNDEIQPGPVALFGSPARRGLLQQAIASGRDWYHGDHGYFRRFQYYRVTKNAYQYAYTGMEETSPLRFQALRLPAPQPWAKAGSAIVICPNSPEYMRWHGVPDAKAWALNVATEISKYSDRPIVIRWKAQQTVRPLYVDLHQAWLVVVFSSASAIEGLLHGIPCCTLAPWATTRAMGITDLSQVESPLFPDTRDHFVHTLADRQWTLEEMRAGRTWKALKEQYGTA